MSQLQQPISRLIERKASAYIVLVVSLLITAGICLYIYETNARDEREQFNSLVNQSRAAIDTRLQTYIATLRAGAALFSASESVSRDEFRRFAESLNLQINYPGIQGIGFTQYIPPEQLEAFVADERAYDRPDFHVWPDTPREQYHAILYLEPLDRRNIAAIGYDMFSEPVRRAAMERARDLAAPSASGRVTLVQEVDGQKQTGFLIYVPVYKGGRVPPAQEERRNQLAGFVYAPFRMNDLMHGVFGELGEGGVAFRIHDSPERTDQNLLYDGRLGEGHHSRQQAMETYNAAGRQWMIEFYSLAALEDQTPRGVVVLTGIAGIALSVVLFSLLRSQEQARTRAERISADLMESESALREARDAAEAANRLKDEFLATVSHELRTPLNAILGWTELLRDPEQSAEDFKHGLDTIERSARSQAQLIEDLLDVSRIISGNMRLKLEPTDIGPQVDSAIEAVAPAAQAKGVKLERVVDEKMCRVLADPMRLQQIVWNLLSNAIKFTPRDGTVTIVATCADGHITLTITDTGIGIDAAFFPHLFQRFSQADGPMTRKHGGLGLGLSIVRHLVEAQGGTVSAQSDGKDRGATFKVILPEVEKSDEL